MGRRVALELVDAAAVSAADYEILVADNGTLLGYVCFGPTPMTVRTFDLYWLVVHAPALIEPYVQEGSAGVVLFASGFGLVALLMFFAARATAKASQAWPVVRGKVIESSTESYRTTINKSHVTLYTPVVEYAYTVTGHDYRSRQIHLNETEGGSQSSAQTVAARYPKDAAVDVHYDPTNPGQATLETTAGAATWVLLAVAAVCFAVAIFAGGGFR